MDALLDIEDVHKQFRTGLSGQTRVNVLNGVSLRVRAGETPGIVGESGCGKTTLARCAVRLLRPTSGFVRFDGMDLNAISPAALRLKRREFQIVFQDASGSLSPHLTVGEALLEPFEAQQLGTKQEREARVRELLDAVALDAGMLSERPARLSGGQQQRIMIARALALKPRLLVADEPVSALDVSVQAQVLNLLADLKKRYALTLILISHALPIVRHLCSRVVVMYLGHVVEDAPSDLFFRQPGHPYSRLLLQSAAWAGNPPIEGVAAVGEIPSPACPPAGCAFHPRCPHVRERCRVEAPKLRSCGGAAVACFLYT